MLAAVEDVVVYSMGYLGVRLGVYDRGTGGGEAGVTSVGEDGGGEVVEERSEVDGRATVSEMARGGIRVMEQQEKVQAGAATPKGSLAVWRRHLLRALWLPARERGRAKLAGRTPVRCPPAHARRRISL